MPQDLFIGIAPPTPAAENRHAAFMLAELSLASLHSIPLMADTIDREIPYSELPGERRLALLRLLKPFLSHVEEMYAPALQVCSSESVLEAVLNLGDDLLDVHIRYGLILAMTVGSPSVPHIGLVNMARSYTKTPLVPTLVLMHHAFGHPELQTIPHGGVIVFDANLCPECAAKMQGGGDSDLALAN